MPEEELCEPLSTLPKFICEINERNTMFEQFFYGLNYSEPISGIAYHPNSTIFVAPILGYDYNHTSDFEGLTHLQDNYFVLLEEQENRVYFLEYLLKDSQFTVLSGHDTGISTIVKQDNDDDGLEGISYDPNTQRLYMLSEKEVDEGRLFSVTLTLPDNNSSGEIHEVSSTSLKHIIPGEAASLFHLGKIHPANSPKSNNILITSKFSSKMREIGLTLDDENNLFECSATLISTHHIKLEPKPSGVSIVSGKIYFANESLDGGLYSYFIRSQNDDCVCNDDDNCNCTADCVYDQYCNCVEKPVCEEVIQISPNNDHDNKPISSLDVSYSSTQSINTRSYNVNNNPDIIILQNEAVNLMSDHIILNEGFKVELGGCLNATIEPCE